MKNSESDEGVEKMAASGGSQGVEKSTLTKDVKKVTKGKSKDKVNAKGGKKINKAGAIRMCCCAKQKKRCSSKKMNRKRNIGKTTDKVRKTAYSKKKAHENRDSYKPILRRLTNAVTEFQLALLTLRKPEEKLEKSTNASDQDTLGEKLNE